jgi:hypothetical protein
MVGKEIRKGGGQKTVNKSSDKKNEGRYSAALGNYGIINHSYNCFKTVRH